MSKNIYRISAAAVIIAFFASIFIVIGKYSSDFTTKEKLMNKNLTGVVLLDRYGDPFFSFYKGRVLNFIPLSDIPKQTSNAFIASEDQDFYSHAGFSPRGIVRSVIKNIEAGDIVSGGSTITQQLVKNALLDSEKTYIRKYQEIILAQAIERKYSKDEILEMYLNSVYFGEGAFGIGPAALIYFDKQPNELSISESAFLAGILPAPSALSPFQGNLDEAIRRQKNVLLRMRNLKLITEEEYLSATSSDLSFNKSEISESQQAPHFALYVRDLLIDKYGEEQIERSGFVVRTTIDLEKQKQAEEIVSSNVSRLSKNNATNGAAVVIDPKTGEILVMVGSKNWYDEDFGKVNMAIAPRQPGSSFKPIVYGIALDKQIITPATVLRDRPTTFDGGYKPKNYDDRFRGNVSVRRALSNSLNVPAVLVMEKVGIDSVLDTAKKLHINSLEDASYYGHGYSLVLGSGEISLLQMTNAYASFANGGEVNSPTAILEIENKYKKKIYSYSPTSQRVYSSGASFLISSILSDSRSRREVFGNTLNTPFPAAVKTGTTENYRDALTIGYTPNITVGVWVGNNDNSPMDSVAGSLGAAPAWKEIISRFVNPDENLQWSTPDGIVRASVCTIIRSSNSTSSATLRSTDFFIEGTVPVSRRCRNYAENEQDRANMSRILENDSNQASPSVMIQ